MIPTARIPWPRVALALVALGIGAWLSPRAEAERPSVELRLNHLTASYRGSTELSDDPDGYQDESFHFAFGGGVRVFPDESGHGVLVEVEHRFDPDIDSIFDEYSSAAAPVTVAHLGYARRFITLLHQRHRFALTTTLTASLALGMMDQGDWDEPRVALMGVRLGLDVDIHARRFFFGWTLQAEVLQHFDGNTSAFITHNFQPLMRVGFMFGRQVQVPYAAERPTELFDLRARGGPEPVARW